MTLSTPRAGIGGGLRLLRDFSCRCTYVLSETTLISAIRMLIFVRHFAASRVFDALSPA